MNTILVILIFTVVYINFGLQTASNDSNTGKHNYSSLSYRQKFRQQLFGDYYAISPDESESSDDSNSADRIVNGKAASISNHRFIVNIRTCPHAPRAGEQVRCEQCGGSILSPAAVVTAAHCLYESRESRRLKICQGNIFYGDIKFQTGSSAKFSCIQDGIIHPSLDVGIINLPAGQGFTGSIYKTIKMGTPQMTPKPGTSVVVAGWGLTEAQKPSQFLKEVTLRVARNADCARYQDFQPGKEICAGRAEEKKDACSGDSGGPLECFGKNGEKYLCGVVSRGAGPPRCGEDNGIYVSLTNKETKEWVEKNARTKAIKGPEKAKKRKKISRNDDYRNRGELSRAKFSPSIQILISLSFLCLLKYHFKAYSIKLG